MREIPWRVSRQVAALMAGHGRVKLAKGQYLDRCVCGYDAPGRDDMTFHITKVAVYSEGIADPEVARVVFRLTQEKFKGTWDELLVTACAVACPPIG